MEKCFEEKLKKYLKTHTLYDIWFTTNDDCRNSVVIGAKNMEKVIKFFLKYLKKRKYGLKEVTQIKQYIGTPKLKYNFRK